MHDRPWFQHYDPGVPRHVTFEDVAVPHFLEHAAFACCSIRYSTLS